jgi:hypothetical protein
MTANDVIESYVNDVAVRLARRQRNDVAFELRALLHEELQARADAAGRAADVAMATELVNAFGRPADVAARYRPTLTIIDPADGHTFLRASLIGCAILWAIGLALQLLPGGDVLSALGRWWTGSVIPSLWWPGLLVVNFGIAAWARRRWPQRSEWKPRPADRIHGGRAALGLGLVYIVCGVLVLLDPAALLNLVLGGHAAPAALTALTYTDTFRQRLAPLLLALLLLNIPLFISVLVQGRWSDRMRRVELALSLVTCAVLAWTALDGPVLLAAASDRTLKSCLLLIVAWQLLQLGVTLRRSVQPSPDRQLQA